MPEQRRARSFGRRAFERGNDGLGARTATDLRRAALRAGLWIGPAFVRSCRHRSTDERDDEHLSMRAARCREWRRLAFAAAEAAQAGSGGGRRVA